MKYIETSTIHCFLLLADSLSFSQTAKRLYLSQSAVSQKISNLEKLLNKQLFIRTNKQVALTNAGIELLPLAKELITIHQKALDIFMTPEISGNIKFGLPEDFATLLLSKILAQFSLDHPLVTLDVECDLSLNLLDSFNRGRFDVVLLKVTNPSRFKGLDVWQEKLAWVAAPGFQFKKNKELPLVLAPEPCVYRSRALDALAKKKISSKIIYTSPSFAGVTAAVKAGLGLTVLPRNMIPEGLINYHHSVLPNLKEVHAFILAKNPKDPAVRSFSEYVIRDL